MNKSKEQPDNSRAEILIIGAAIIDVLVRPADETVFDTGSYAAEDITMSVGADALNEATILARMGKKVRLNTVLGADKAGEFLQKHICNCGIEMDRSCVKEELKTGINVVLVKPDGSRCFLTNPRGSLRHLRISDIQMPFPDSVQIICFASIFVFPHIKTEELFQIFSQAKKQGKIVCADMTKCKNKETPDEMAEAFAEIDYLFPNDEEAMLFTRKTTVEEAAEAFVNAGVKHVIIKCGARGAFVRTRTEAYWAPAKEGISVIDTTGAGDSFVAGFLAALSEGKCLEECVKNANNCGARAVSVVGATEWIEKI